MWKYVLFDLDGTLTDPKTGITKSVQYALKHYGIKVENPDELTHFIGPPLRESFRKYYGFNEGETNRAVLKYREYFSEKGIYENTMFAGIPELLEALKSSGRSVILATSKPAVFANLILRNFSIDSYFDFVSGCELDGARSEKAEVISYAIENCPVGDISRAVMVGDRMHDIIGAKKTGLASVGVLYGYGDRGELRGAGADMIVRDIAELTDVLLDK